MVRKLKKKTLFFAGILGLSLLSFFGARGSSADDVLSEKDLRNLLATTPVHADVGPSDGSPSSPTYDPCPSGPCDGGF